MKINKLIISLLALTSMFIPIKVNAEQGSTLFITPASGTATIGSQINLSLVEDGENINVVSATLDYDQTKLNCNSIENGEFQETVFSKCSNGKVEITKFVTPGQPAFSGQKVVVSIVFTALTEGVADLTITKAQVVSAGINTITNTSGASFTITPPAVTDGRGGDEDRVITVSSNNSVQGANTSSAAYSNLVADYNGIYNVASGDNTIASSSTSTDKKAEDKTEPNEENNTNNSENKEDKKSNNGQKLLALLALIAITAATVAAGRARAAKEEELAAAAAAAAAKKKSTKAKTNQKRKTSAKKKPNKK